MTGQSQKFTQDFRREAVRLSRESGRRVRQITDDFGVGMSTLTKWRAVMSYIWTKEGWLLLWICIPGASSAGQPDRG